MAKLTKESLLKRAFLDPKNYPYGFSRSGDFSIGESQALSRYGTLVAALVDGQIEPEDEEDHALIAAARGDKAPSTVIEKAWCKYQKRINRPKLGSIYGSKSRVVADSDDMGEDTDMEIELDD
ncbi:DUF413 domain-containing protein [Aliiglaciecola sp. CAU 1673]|uniref:DUF413 domain-containing protein n=1 Tax=Aliiglaciecola sp. CAU 1673 TaxID=3032595 RepID=UPI0023DBCED1|nr:DUF413 domain-containing protein [Aliiglaciecola sp. CAU 1673]MDF2178717.1 DUF413 domain-containing protein [Aliiglaciecola sp. CAU 1673]